MKTATLTHHLAWPLGRETSVPAGCTGMRIRGAEFLERFREGRPVSAALKRADETFWLVRHGPHPLVVALDPSARDVGLFLTVGLSQGASDAFSNCFESVLAARPDRPVTVEGLAHEVQQWLQASLRQGTLDLPPCETAEEWRAFRLALGHGLHARFGLEIGECFLVDLADPPVNAHQAIPWPAVEPLIADSPQQIPLKRMPEAPLPVRQKTATDPALNKRLFIELPRVARSLRMRNLPKEEEAAVTRQFALAMRLDALARRATLRAVSKPGQSGLNPNTAQDLDDAWAVIARLGSDEAAGRAHLDRTLDDADRIVSNLEVALGDAQRT